jgi:hypothetical protein
VPSVVGQTRLQDALSLAQLAKHASAEASANRNLPNLSALVPASATLDMEKISAANTASFMKNLRFSRR